ncbi:NAD(P)H-dependent flavin oxidoreductase [Aquella oligotrophica]|uniref:NAD(P)H-dependent flavin oxidoreductase n=1 Tax=Aquella oligotrophica TaxID=2067065 RepID=UPI001315A154|nr:nitronate monooxygenase [Aquella oligotrophica]
MIKVKYPIIQAPMAGGVVTAELVARVSNSGLLGSIPAGYLSKESLEDFIIKTRNLTSAPVILNVFVEDYRETSIISPKPQRIIEAENRLGLSLEESFIIPPTLHVNDYLELAIKYAIPAVSTTFGLFSPEVTASFQQNGISVLATVTNLEEAYLAKKHNVDALIIQGSEAGGHQGSFLSTTNANQFTTLELTKQIRESNLGLPLVAAGGINLQNIYQYWNAGADFLQLGTLFMLSDCAGISYEQQSFILNKPSLATELTKGITGKWVRSIKNELFNYLDFPDFNYPAQHYASSRLRAMAKNSGNFEWAGIWLGQHDKYQFIETDKLIVELQHKYLEYINGL